MQTFNLKIIDLACVLFDARYMHLWCILRETTVRETIYQWLISYELRLPTVQNVTILI